MEKHSFCWKGQGFMLGLCQIFRYSFLYVCSYCPSKVFKQLVFICMHHFTSLLPGYSPCFLAALWIFSSQHSIWAFHSFCSGFYLNSISLGLFLFLSFFFLPYFLPLLLISRFLVTDRLCCLSEQWHQYLMCPSLNEHCFFILPFTFIIHWLFWVLYHIFWVFELVLHSQKFYIKEEAAKDTTWLQLLVVFLFFPDWLWHFVIRH